MIVPALALSEPIASVSEAEACIRQESPASSASSAKRYMGATAPSAPRTFSDAVSTLAICI